MNTVPSIALPIPNLYDYALAKARESAKGRRLRKDAEASGLDYSWFGKFARGTIPGASYDKVYAVASYYWGLEQRAASPATHSAGASQSVN